MALDRLQSVTSHLTGNTTPPHPFDPLSNAEIEHAVAIIRKEHGKVAYNAISLHEPRKKEMLAWLADPNTAPRPARIADVVVIGAGSKVYDGLVDLKSGKILEWITMEGVQPLVSLSTEFNSKSLRLGRTLLMIVDYYGGSTNCRNCYAKRPKSH